MDRLILDDKTGKSSSTNHFLQPWYEEYISEHSTFWTLKQMDYSSGRPKPGANSVSWEWETKATIYTGSPKLDNTIKYNITSFQLWNIYWIYPSLSPHTVSILVHSLTSHIDYCNSLLVDLSHKSLWKLQMVQNSVALIITKTLSFHHITPVQEQLHLLPVRFRIQFQNLLYAFKVIHNLITSHLFYLLHPLCSFSSIHLPMPCLHWHHRKLRFFLLCSISRFAIYKCDSTRLSPYRFFTEQICNCDLFLCAEDHQWKVGKNLTGHCVRATPLLWFLIAL